MSFKKNPVVSIYLDWISQTTKLLKQYSVNAPLHGENCRIVTLPPSDLYENVVPTNKKTFANTLYVPSCPRWGHLNEIQHVTTHITSNYLLNIKFYARTVIAILWRNESVAFAFMFVLILRHVNTGNTLLGADRKDPSLAKDASWPTIADSDSVTNISTL